MNKNCIARLFYKSKHSKEKTNNNTINAMLLPSLLGIFICAICLMGSTWAWFTATQSTATQTIQAANYNVSAVVMLGDSEITAENDKYILETGTYTVTLTALGDATTGYCKVKLGNSEKLTQQFPSTEYHEKSIAFTLVLHETTTVEFISWWGTSIVDDTERIQNGSEHIYGKAEENPSADKNGDATELPTE